LFLAGLRDQRHAFPARIFLPTSFATERAVKRARAGPAPEAFSHACTTISFCERPDAPRDPLIFAGSGSRKDWIGETPNSFRGTSRLKPWHPSTSSGTDGAARLQQMVTS
jgi:hypothetical protein